MDSENLSTSENDFGDVDAFSQRLILEESQSFVEDSDITLEEIKNDQQSFDKSATQGDEKSATEAASINLDISEKSETQDIFENLSESNGTDQKSTETAPTVTEEKGKKRKGSESEEFHSPPKLLKSEATNSEDTTKSDSTDNSHENESKTNSAKEQQLEKSEKSNGTETADSSVEIINLTGQDSFADLDTSKNHSSNEVNDSTNETDSATTSKTEQSSQKSSQKDTSTYSHNSTEDITSIDISKEIATNLSNGDANDSEKAKVTADTVTKPEKEKPESKPEMEEDNKTFLAERNISGDSTKISQRHSHESGDTKSAEPVLKKHIFYVEVTYAVNEEKDPATKEIAQVICDDVTDLMLPTHKRYSDVSTGNMGDVSKNESPRSSVSGPGPFQIPNRYSIISNSSRLSTLSRFSTSSTSSIVSSASTLAARMSTALPEEHFAVPDARPLRHREKLVTEKKLTSEQIDSLQARWTNSEQLLKILEAIDKSHCPGVQADHLMEVNGKDEKNRTPEKQKLESIEEMSASKSEKRSIRRKRPQKATSDDEEPKSASNSSSNATLTTPTSVRGRARKTKRSASNTAEPQVETKTEPEPFVPEGTNISVGQVVFARWTDRKYYSGVIGEHVKDNKWLVKFDDGNTKALIEDYIIAGCHSSLKGQSVYALIKKTGEYDAGIVTKSWVEPGPKFRYEVEVDSGAVVKVFADEIFLTEDQAKTIKEINRMTTPPGTPKLGTVSLDNIVEGKRATRSNKKYGNIFSPRPGVSGTRKMTPRKLDSEDEKSIDSRSECALEEIGGVEPELKISTPLKGGKGPGKVKGNVKGLKRLPKYKSLDHDLGPVPDNDSIFNGLSFLLVCVGAQTASNSETNSAKEKSQTDSGTDNETKEFSKIPFLEEHLKQQIIGGGGILYQHFEEVPPSDYDQCVLISNRPNRTAKYIQCIAAGITIVSHEWVIRCCRENRRLNYQELPIGWSLESEKFIESFHRKNTKPFKDYLIYLAPNMDKQFLKFWERVCTLAGGQVAVMDNEEADFQNATCVIADNECSERIVDRASSWDIPLLSTAWIVQSIIHGETRAFNGHVKYAYDCVEFD